jgi:hypothetical protein
MKYNYTISNVCLDRLTKEINLSTIIITALSCINLSGTSLDILFKAELSLDEKAELDTIIENHTGEKLIEETITKITGDVTPTVPKLEYISKPYGLTHKHIDSSEQITDITLSNKNGKLIDFVCDVTPEFYDCIFQEDSEIRDGVYSVDGSTITTFMGRLNEGSAILSKPVNLDYKVEVMEEVDSVYVFGIYIDVEDYGDDDIIRLQIVSGESGNIIQEYDECWVRQVSNLIKINNPSNYIEVKVGDILRLSYYPKDPTKNNVKVWKDYIIKQKI